MEENQLDDEIYPGVNSIYHHIMSRTVQDQTRNHQPSEKEFCLRELCEQDASKPEGKDMVAWMKCSDAQLKTPTMTKQLKNTNRDWFNPKILAGAFPRLTAFLRREGDTQAQSVAEALAWKVYEEDLRPVKFSFSHARVRQLAEHIIPYAEGDDELLREEKRVLFMDLMLKQLKPGDAITLPKIRTYFKKTLKASKKDLIRTFYKRDKGRFYESCPLAKVELSYEEFEAILEEEQTPPWDPIMSRVIGLAESLLPSLGIVSRRGGQWKNICWECDKVVDGLEDGIKQMAACSQCRAARYCGQACQLKAWKEGHKSACKHLKSIYERHEVDRKLVEAAHGDPQAHKRRFGISPESILCDYSLASHLCTALPHPVLGVPSMANFYENLGKVKAGILWFSVPLTTNEPVEFEAIEKHELDALDATIDHDVDVEFRIICDCLTFPLGACNVLDPVSVLAQLYFKGTLHLFPQGPRRIMTPRYFLARYVWYHNGFSTSPERGRWYSKEQALKKMQKFHKTTPAELAASQMTAISLVDGSEIVD